MERRPNTQAFSTNKNAGARPAFVVFDEFEITVR
jgi:hypothetical protein